MIKKKKRVKNKNVLGVFSSKQPRVKKVSDY